VPPGLVHFLLCLLKLCLLQLAWDTGHVAVHITTTRGTTGEEHSGAGYLIFHGSGQLHAAGAGDVCAQGDF
jgi:hypothetical protein